jgi:hypothetical protein
MARVLRVLCWLVVASCVGTAAAEAQDGVRYARCNLKVLGGNEITWINWQAAPSFLPVNTKLRVTRTGDKATLVAVDTGASYTMDVGADGDAYLEKFVTAQPVNVQRFSEEVRENIAKAIAKVGMTKEQVYIAMGPPTNLGKARTNTMTYDNVMAGDSWIYARRRFGKNIGVAFDAKGIVTRTEGIWGKD